jgi:hypothetical protein
MLPGLQTIFLPGYPALNQRLQLQQTKVFPEPIDGERLLESIETATKARFTGRDLFHVLDLIQLCCLSRKTGAIQMVNEDGSGIIYLNQGRIVHAETAKTQAKEALLEIVSWGLVEFAYDTSMRSRETISVAWDAVLARDASTPTRDNRQRNEATGRDKLFESHAFTSRTKRGLFDALRRG